MPVRQKAQDAGIFEPAELEFLARVFDRLKYQEQTADEREALASRILANFMAGIQDEEELVSLSRLPLGRSHVLSGSTVVASLVGLAVAAKLQPFT